MEAGVTARQIKLRLRNARLHEIHRGVYLPGHSVARQLREDPGGVLARLFRALELAGYPATG
jgi:hypothetical protein